MVQIPTPSGFVIVGAAAGQIFASQVGGVGIVGSFGGLGLGTPVIIVSGAIAGAAVSGIVEGLETGDVKILGVTTVGSILGAGLNASVGNLGVSVAGTAFGIGMGTMAITGGIFALGVYQLVKKFVKSNVKESFDSLFDRINAQVSEQEFYIQSLLELDPILQELTWYQKFSGLDTDAELAALKTWLNLNAPSDDSQGYEWHPFDDPTALQQLKQQLQTSAETWQNISSPPEPQDALMIIKLPSLTWQATTLKHFENPVILDLSISQDSQYLYSANANGTIFAWDLQKMRHNCTYISSKEEVLAVAISPNHQKLFVAGCNAFISAWHIQSKTISTGFYSLNPADRGSHNSIITALACSPDGKHLASGDKEGGIKLWDAIANQWQRNLNGHKGSIQALEFSPDSQLLISGGEDGKIYLWSVNDWRKNSILGEHPGKITALAIAAAGKYLVSASIDGTVKIWNLADQGCWRTFTAHDSNLLGMAVNPQNCLIATATTQCVKLWDWHTQHCTDILDGCFPLQFSPDGQLLVTVHPTPRKGLKIWRLGFRSDKTSATSPMVFDATAPWWEVLNVDPDADHQTVKAAYYALAKQFHPDQNAHQNGDRQGSDRWIAAMQHINHAYDQYQRQQR